MDSYLWNINGSGKRICTPVKSSCESAVNENNIYIYKKTHCILYYILEIIILFHLMAQSQ